MTSTSPRDTDRVPPPHVLDGVVGRHSADYMLRNVHQQLVQLSAQADLKANIILTASVLVLSVALSRINAGSHRWTLIAVVVGVFVALLFAIGAVLPNLRLRRRAFDPRRDFDVLYFADFARLDFPEFEYQMGSALHDDAEIYRLMIRNIHNQGRYLLGQKYRYIRYSYICFVGAIVAGGLSELIRLV